MALDKKLITIDGPSGAGKGTVSQRLAKQLGWTFLDSGAIYRLCGLAWFFCPIAWSVVVNPTAQWAGIAHFKGY